VISLAAVFTILLVSGNTMAMSIRERTREVAVLKTLGFRRDTILTLFVGEATGIATIGGILGTFFAAGMLWLATHIPQIGNIFTFALHEWIHAAPECWAVAILAGLLSSAIPAYLASRTGIVEGLRHIG